VEGKPKTVVSTYRLVQVFKKHGAEVGEKCSENLIFDIANKLKEIFRREDPEHAFDVKYEGKTHRISVKHIKDFEFEGQIGLKKESPKKMTKALIEEILGEVETEKIFDFKIENCRDKETFVKQLKEKIIKQFKNINSGLEKEIEYLYERIYEDYSYIWLPSLFSDPDVGLYEVKETLTLILRDITLAKCKKDINAAKRIFDKFLGTEYPYRIFKRIVLFVIGNRWDSFKDKFWEIIDAENGKLFDDSYFQPEIYNLLKRNLSKFKDEEKEKIKSIIEKGPQHLPTGIDKQKYIAGWKQKWYSVLKRDSYFAPLYKKYKKISGIEKEEFSFETQFETRVGPGPSPLTKEEILRMSNEDLSKFLKEFRTKDSWKGPTVGGLADVLKEAVKEKPEKFIEKILDGIKEAWSEKKLIEWSKLLNFIEKYINREDFWNDKFIIEDEGWPAHANHKGVVASVAELLHTGIKDDAWAFPEKYFSQTKKIIFLMLDKLKVEDKDEIHDFVTHALNSAFGEVIAAFISLALRIARVNKKKGIGHY